jgi:glucosamine--fructose-6-phosphate aminotransferase (isomerizing)
MCGIIGYVGKEHKAPDVLYSGLEKLEYRGYDSCGVAVFGEKAQPVFARYLCAPSEVEYGHALPKSNCGIGHTRWATHGKVSLNNTHPHISSCGQVYLVHNGVIENSEEIRNSLTCEFSGETDSESLVNLIAFHYKESKDPLSSISQALLQVEGTYGLAIMFENLQDVIFAVRRSSPLVVGVGDGEHYIVSDTNALPPNIDKIIYLDDENIVKLNKDKFDIYDLNKQQVEKADTKIRERRQHVSLGIYSSYLEKEILEQGNSIRDTLRGRFTEDFLNVKLGGININKKINRVLFLGCGTAYHAGLLGKYYMENVAKIPASVEHSSEYKYKNNPTEDGTLVVGISQSGETLDTLGALKEAKNKGLDTMAITNTVMSSIARQVPEGIYQRIGPEVSVASTKAFTSQALLTLMLAISLGRRDNLSVLEAKKYIDGIRLLPELVERTLDIAQASCVSLAKNMQLTQSIVFLGRQYMYPIALEAALKLKELIYIPTHGYPSGEIKHGPLAQISEGSHCFFVAPENSLQDKNVSNMKEISARGGRNILIKQKGQQFPEDCYFKSVEIANAPDFLLPILSVLPLQLFCLNMAIEKGCNIDKPRNLAKSVTVE